MLAKMDGRNIFRENRNVWGEDVRHIFLISYASQMPVCVGSTVILVLFVQICRVNTHICRDIECCILITFHVSTELKILLRKICLKIGSMDLTGIEKDVNWDKLFSLPKDYWVEDMAETKRFLEVELGEDMPPVVHKEVLDQVERISKM